MHRPIVIVLAVLLAACTPEEPPVVPPPLPPADACGASGLQSLVGRPATVLETMKFAGPLRIIRPGMAVTMDYSPGRLNIEIDKGGRISRVSCG
jgi:hypothetical protein